MDASGRAPVLRRFLTPAALGVLIPLVGCSDVLEPHAPANVRAVRGSGQTAAVGQELADSLVVRVVDAIGRPVAGVPVAWRGAEGEGTVSSEWARTDPRGRSAVAWTLGPEVGVQRVEAEVAGLDQVSFWATGTVGPTARLRITPDSVIVPIAGDTVHLRVEGEDANGNTVRSLTVAWVSLDGAVAEVDERGVVVGVGEGVARIVAVSGIAADTAVFAVYDDPNRPRIAAIAADTLWPGASVVITGERFAPVAGDNVVTVDGVPVEVVEAAPTRLEVKLPNALYFRCAPTREAAVIVRAGPNRDTGWKPLTVAARRALAPGEILMLLDPEQARCNELTETEGDYVISVVNVSAMPAAIATIQLRGVRPDATAQVAAPRGDAARHNLAARGGVANSPSSAGPALRRGGGAAASAATGPLPDRRRAAELHRRVLDASRRLVEEMPARASVTGQRGAAPRHRTGPLDVTTGDTVTLHVPRLFTLNPCMEFREIRARAVHAGEHAVLYEDADAPLAGSMDSLYRALGTEFDEVMYPLLRHHFGDPLAFDDQLRGEGRVAMLFTRAVNDFGGIVGFVWAGDFYERAQCPASNERATLYAVVPTADRSDFDRDTPAGWHRRIRSVVMHEAKHVVSMAERFARNGGSSLEATWLEEASAMLASELYGREVYGYARHGETDYRSSLYCELRPGECAGAPLVMLDHFAWLYDYLHDMPARTPLGSIAQGDASFYGSGWAFLRWALDRYANDEATFLRALTQEPHLRGIDNLRTRAGVDREALVAGWTLSLGLAGTDAARNGAAPPSWNLRDIFEGLSDDLPQYFATPDPRRIQRLEMGDFAVDVAMLLGGSGALFELEGRPGFGQLLELAHPSGALASNTVRIAIARVR